MNKVTIIKGNKAKDSEGNIYDVNALNIVRPNGITQYVPSERFFQVACPIGTKHSFSIASNGKINLS